MGLLSNKKKKNDEPRRNPWLPVIIIGLGVGVVLLVLIAFGTRPTSTSNITTGNDEGLFLTATHVVEQATGTAGAVVASAEEQLSPADLDPIQLTATYIIDMATQTVTSP